MDNDVMLTLMGLIWRTPENEIERRTPSKIKYQNKYRYIHESGSYHTALLSPITGSQPGDIRLTTCFLCAKRYSRSSADKRGRAIQGGRLQAAASQQFQDSSARKEGYSKQIQ
jgi:hypothetical protein